MNCCDLGDAPSFSDYTARCLYDPTFGFYASGRVRFDHATGQFWTWPKRLSPLFGWMIADALRSLFAQLLAEGAIPDTRPLTILELGAGDGDLARDVLDRIDSLSLLPEWREIAPRIRYVVGEKSAALRARQCERLAGHIACGRASVREMDATSFEWEGPFAGAVIGNELIDAFPCERWHLSGPTDVNRVHVQGRARDGEPLSADAVWSAVAEGRGHEVWWEQLEVPLPVSFGGVVPSWIGDYLESLAPMIADLHKARVLPVALHAPAGMVGFIESLGKLLTGFDRRGLALIIDYGGTSRYVLDPRTRIPHFRVYSGYPEIDRTSSPYTAPGEQDMTFDVDFTELGRLAEKHRLTLTHYASQGILEAANVDLWSPELRSHAIAGRLAEGYPADEAEHHAEYMVHCFRESPGFRTAILAPPDFRVPRDRFGESELAGGSALDTIASRVAPAALDRALSDLDRPGDWLLPCCDIAGTLGDHDQYARRSEVLRILRERGWLVPPGSV